MNPNSTTKAMKAMATNQADAVLFMCRQLPITCAQKNTKRTDICMDRIQNIIECGVRKLGYEYVRYSYWVKDVLNEKSATTNAFSVNISNFPPEWERCYNSESLYVHDPIVRLMQDGASKQNLTHGTWRDAYAFAKRCPLGETVDQKEDYIKNVKQLISSSQEHGLVSGYYYSWGDDFRHIVMSIASPKKNIDVLSKNNDFINSLHSMVILANQAVLMTKGCVQCTKALRIDGSDPIVLSEAELRILQLFYKNRNATQKEVADQYGRSVDTVNHHLKSIRRKMNISGASGHFLAAYADELNLF